VILAAILLEEQRFPRRRTMWVKPGLMHRVMLGQYDTLMQELMRESHGDFKSFLHIEPAMFQELLVRVTPRISKSQESRPPLEPGLKLAITLLFLATGNSYHSLAFDFRVAHNTILLFVPEVCDAIVAEYQDEVFQTPLTVDGWMQVANKFGQRWNFHHACGAIDRKHIAIKKPSKSSSLYYNYKHFFSIILLALVDGDYKFLWATVGANGAASDCGVFNRSSLLPDLCEGTLGLPPPEPLPNDDIAIPYFLIGDDAFALRTYMLKPFVHRFLTH
jgi:hypothetical protein